MQDSIKSNRLTAPLQEATQGNTKKYDKYREAWTRIQQAQKNMFFLEAIAIEESIISDRLSSYLKAKDLYPQKKGFVSFGNLISAWQKACPQPIEINAIENLQDAVSSWRRKRNEAVHAIVKSTSERPDLDVDGFLKSAKAAAEEGEDLAKAVQKWKRQASKELS